MAQTVEKKRPSNRFISLQSIPTNVLFITIACSWVGMVAAIILSYPLWVVGLVTILPWIPVLFTESLWKYKHYKWFAIFGVLMLVQLLHFVEHIAQIVQVDVIGRPRLLSTGILGGLDLEPVHFGFDTTLLILTSILVFGRFRHNLVLWAAWVVAVWHTIEHWYITYYWAFDRCNYDVSNMTFQMDHCTFTEAHPGLLAREGLLGNMGLLWYSSPFPRIELHFIYNLLYTVPLVWAFILVVRQAYDEYLKQAFPRLNAQQLAGLNNNIESVQVEPGSMIIHQGEPADKFYILSSGEVEIIQQAGGAPVVVNRLTKGQFFGEVGLLTGAPRNASVRAVTKCDLLVLNRETFQAIIGSSAPTAQDFSAILAQRSGARIPVAAFAAGAPVGGGASAPNIAAFQPGGGGGFPPPFSNPSLPASGPPFVPPASGPNLPQLGGTPALGMPAAPPLPASRPSFEPPTAPDLANILDRPTEPTAFSPPDDRALRTIEQRVPVFRDAASGWAYGLVFTSGPQSGQGVVLSTERMVIGRDVGNEIRLTDDAQVSRRHAELLRLPNGDYQLRDLRSSNGVFVNGERIAAEVPRLLKEDDEVKIGNATFAFRKVGARVV